MGATLAALSGINNISGPGMIDFESCHSLEKLVVDNPSLLNLLLMGAINRSMVAGDLARGLSIVPSSCGSIPFQLIHSIGVSRITLRLVVYTVKIIASEDRKELFHETGGEVFK